MNKIERIYDNTKDGIPNYAISTTDGKMLYARGMPLYPVPKSGDVIKYSIVNTKTSEKGNQYSNIKDVQIVTNGQTSEEQAQQQAQYEQAVPVQATQPAPQSLGNVVENSGWNSPTVQALTSPQPPQQNNGFSKSDTQRLDIFVTGIVGRSMGSGQFSVHDIGELTRNAVSAFNENLKKL